MIKGIGCQKCNWTGYMQGLANKLPVACLECSKNIYKEENLVGVSIVDNVKEDMVNSPKHYTFGKIEVITVIDDWQLGFYEGQVIKYVGRAKHKGNELQDLKKAQWYLNRLIEQKEK